MSCEQYWQVALDLVKFLWVFAAVPAAYFLGRTHK